MQRLFDIRLAAYSKVELQNTLPGRVDFGAHTMGRDALRQYIGRKAKSCDTVDTKKMSDAQIKMLITAYNNGVPVRVISAYRSDLNMLAQSNGMALSGDIAFHDRPTKLFNSLRHLMVFVKATSATPKHIAPQELWALVFPSKQYVEQIGEFISGLFADLKAFGSAHSKAKTPPNVYISHFSDLENSIARWTGFVDFMKFAVRHGDAALIGNVDLLLPTLQNFQFDAHRDLFTYGGLDNMFGAQVTLNSASGTRLVIVGVKECFWGDASAQYARALVDLGVRHLLYGSKAASLVDGDEIHACYSPSSFALLLREQTGDRAEPIPLGQAPAERLMQSFGIHPSGVSITVPTVMGEDQDEQAVYKRSGATCMDCENGHIAKSILEFNQTVGRGSTLSHPDFSAQFVPAHFITDYIHRKDDSFHKGRPSLAHHSGSPGYDKARSEAFSRIGGFFASYALMFGVSDPVLPAIALDRQPVFGDQTLKRIYDAVTPMLSAGLGQQALQAILAGQDSSNLKPEALLAYAMVCQKHGMINHAFRTLKLLDGAPKEIITIDNAVRAKVIALKTWSQLGSASQMRRLVNELQQLDESALARVHQFGAVMRRMAVMEALDGKPEGAAKAISIAQDAEDKKDAHSKQNNLFYREISSFALGTTQALSDFSANLSSVREGYMSSGPPAAWWQTNFDKCALATIFLEAAAYLSTGITDLIERGARALFLAHLVNLRVGGNEASETYGEIVACTANLRVRNLISLAMRLDVTAQNRFESWLHSEFPRLTAIAPRCLDVLKTSAEHREALVTSILDKGAV